MRYEHDHENDTIYFGKVNFRNSMRTFGLKTDDRRRHTYVIGKTGMGKTTLLENMILSDIYAGHGCCYIDPHGDTAEKLLDFIPSWRINDVVYFNPADMQHPIGFNILESVGEEVKHLVAAGLMGVFKKIWEGVWSARMEYIMNNTILALLDTPGTTLLGINRMLSDAEYRTMIIKNIKDPIIKQFWIKEFGNYQDKFASEAVAPIQNKVGQFLSAAIVRNIVAQAKSGMNIRRIMDDQMIFIVNLSKGYIGEDASRLLGGMLITKIQMSAMERVDMPECERIDFYMYVDEFQNFAVESFASILSEARKYRLNLIMAHQYIAQLTEEVRDAVFGNVGTIISFRVGSPDAMFMESEFMPRFTPEDIINLPKFSIYLKLMIDGVTSQPFSAATLPPIGVVTGSKEKVIAQSRERYAGNKEMIEKNVAVWSGFGEGLDVDVEMKAVKDKKKAAKKAKYMHSYDCSRCDKTFELPVELDRSRPIYCEECNKIVKSEREKRQHRKHEKKDKKIVPAILKDKGQIIEKKLEKAVSLTALLDGKEKKQKDYNSNSYKKQSENKGSTHRASHVFNNSKRDDLVQKKAVQNGSINEINKQSTTLSSVSSESEKRTRKRRRRNRKVQENDIDRRDNKGIERFTKVKGIDNQNQKNDKSDGVASDKRKIIGQIVKPEARQKLDNGDKTTGNIITPGQIIHFDE